jgi:hypothetical protein
MKALVECFRRFMQRGTIPEWCKLLPQGFDTGEVIKCLECHQRPAADVAAMKPPQPHNGALDHEAAHVKYFEVLMQHEEKGKQRLKRLNKISQSITSSQSTTESVQIYKNSATTGLIAQAKEIYQTIEGQGDASYRHSVILFGDAVDRYALLPSNQLSRGRDQKTAALEQIATGLGKEKKDVSNMYTRSRQYLKFVEYGGPALLRLIKGCKWE